jgi:hypothetical protein
LLHFEQSAWVGQTKVVLIYVRIFYCHIDNPRYGYDLESILHQA